ncbi:lipoxygenase family protein [Aureispira anguillae]|uniref:Lipoxygenase domain-containing protein n=1 Tax=Aureispira anguillae TaxID=2864201 RepID=A0A916DXR8_9BACT|nr:lipoxygenase family protein [Aureispira anguillae]BDS15341.1 hypothetical protein AsAng_0061250 [Aureispira anguillae]
MRKVKGRLVSTVRKDNEIKPIANASLQLWDLDLIENDFLTAGTTDEAGYFELEYDPNKGNKWNDIPDLVLRFLDREYSYDKMGQPVSNWFVVKNFHAGNNITAKVFDFGTLQVAFWEYEDTEGLNNVCFTPRVAIVDKKTPQAQRPGRTSEQIQVGLTHFIAHNKHTLVTKFSNHHPSNVEIEDDYELNRTRKIKEKSRSDDFLSDMVLNGFNPCNLKKGTKENTYFVDFKWDGLELDTRHFAPNTTANFKLINNKLKLESIALQKRLGGDNSAHAQYRKPKLYTPQDPEWGRIKRIFRCNYFLFGEVETHLSETHLNIEQYIIPIRRNLLNNPIARLLLPHFYGTTDVNMAANEILLSADGLVQKCSALTPKSVKKISRTAFGTLNWYGWKPRKPLCKGHSFAEIGQLYWKTLNRYVRKYVNANLSQIKQYWKEIRTMSEELVFHSLPYVPLSEQLYYDKNEINTSNKIHPYVNGKESAISPVTVTDSPEKKDINNIIQFCCYLIFHATFKHSWINDLQYEMGGEIEFATLGITDDISNMRVDESLVVPPEEAIEHPFITYILNYTEYGYIMRNEDDDVNPELVKYLVKNRTEFQKLGYDIRAMRSCINI